MSGRYRTVALQAVGVAVLAAIIYLAFLRPNDPDPLSGITGPAGEQQARSNAGDHSNRRHGGRQQPDRGDNGNASKNSGPNTVKRPGKRSPGPTPGAGSNPSSPGGESTGPQPGSGPPDTSGGIEPPGPETPPGSQYQDTVARITAKLNE